MSIDEILTNYYRRTIRIDGNTPNARQEAKQAIEDYYKNKIPKKYKEELVQNYDYNCHACCIKQSFCGDKDCYEDVYKMQGYNQAIDDITEAFNEYR